ncbi:MAG: 7TM diverse intracellular signaling domain-containing protein [Halioglobus sp.]
MFYASYQASARIVEKRISRGFFSSTVLVFCFLLAADRSWGQVLELTGTEAGPTRPALSYLFDDDGELPLEAVISRPDADFTDSGVGGLALGFTRRVLWLRLDVINSAEPDTDWLLQVNDALLDDIRVYQKSANGEWLETRLGDNNAQAINAVDSVTPVIPVALAAGETTRFFIRIESDSSLLVDLRFMTARQFYKHSMMSFLAYGAMFGIVAAMCLYNLFLFFSLRDFNYLLYVVSMLSTSLFLASLSGHAPKWLWPGYTAWTEEIYQVICAIVVMSGLWFAIRFLEVPQRAPFMHKAMLLLIVMAGLTVPFAQVTNFQIAVHLTGVVSAAAGAAGITAAIVSLRDGHRPARYYLLAWMGYCLGAILMAGRRHGLIENNFVTTHAMEVGAVLETVLISFALSDRYNLLRQAKEDAQREVAESLRRMDKLKDEFLANTSHELRTPLQGIIGLAESMLDGAAGKVGETAAHNLSMIVSSGHRLASLVNDILDFSKMKNRDLQLNARAVDLHVAVDVVMHLSAPMARAKSLQLINEVDDSVPQVIADENRLQQVLHNLIGNGIKFTDSGSVRVRAQLEEDRVRIKIIDTGPGIAESDRERIFESFEQIEDSATRAHGGTGLGLAVTRDLLALHGTSIDLESSQGAGSTFSFTLPQADTSEVDDAAEKIEAAEVPEFSPAEVLLEREVRAVEEAAFSGDTTNLLVVEEGETSADRIRILVVDDEPINQQVMQNHLVVENYEAVQAENGMRALELLEQGHEFDLILLDVMMPKLSGFEVCREIRRTHLPTQLPIVMVTARTQLQDLQVGLQVGANDYLTKPVAKDELLARIKTHLNLMHINSEYSRYVPHEFLRYLNRDSILDVRLGDNVEIEAAVFISDIRSFTTLSETMEPGTNFSFINDYLAYTGPPIRENHGFIDRYSGDSVMGVFPGGAEDAMQAARDTMARLREFNQQREAEGLEEIQIGIGLHMGSLRLGIVGEQQRRQGDIFSDTVNVANRIEGMTKTYGTKIIVSDAFVAALDNPDISLPLRRDLGGVRVKGRAEVVVLHEVFEFDDAETVTLKRDTQAEFKTVRSLLEEGRYVDAAGLLKEIIDRNPQDAAARYLHQLASSRVGQVSEDA